MKLIRVRTLLFILLVAAASEAQYSTTGVTWQLVSKTPGESIFRSTHIILRTDHGTIIAWEKLVPRSDTTEGRESRNQTLHTLIGMVGEKRANTYSYQLKIEEYDCVEHMKRTLQFKFYDSLGNNIQNVPEFHYTRNGKVFQGPPPPIPKNAKPEWWRPPASSLGGGILDAVCAER
jgi:hypothetical protein